MAVITVRSTFINTPKVDLTHFGERLFDTMISSLPVTNKPGGGQLVDLSTYNSMAHQISGAVSCEELNRLSNKAIQAVETQVEGMLSQIEALAPCLALLTIPHDPITWIIQFIMAYLIPYVKPYYALIQQVAGTLVEVEQIASTVANAVENLENCQLNLQVGLPKSNVTRLFTEAVGGGGATITVNPRR